MIECLQLHIQYSGIYGTDAVANVLQDTTAPASSTSNQTHTY